MLSSEISRSHAPSGTSGGKHPTTFVRVELDAGAPTDALALVLRSAAGVPLSFGTVTAGQAQISVYSTEGGCVTEFPDGTVVAQPGDHVVAFWVDASGRRSTAFTNNGQAPRHRRGRWCLCRCCTMGF